MSTFKHKPLVITFFLTLIAFSVSASPIADRLFLALKANINLCLQSHGNDQLFIVPPPPSSTFSKRVSASSDDAEQSLSLATVSLISNDIEFVQDGAANQISGMRFTGITIPKGATITSAYVEFKAKAVNSGGITLTLSGQAIDNAPTFTTANNNISARTKTTATVAWSPANWATIGTAYQTSSITTIVQEIVNRPGWASGNSMVIMATGPTTSTRTAQSYDGVPASAPLLVVNYTVAEICGNSIDDDGDGLADCSDSDCDKITLSNVTVSPCINQPLADIATMSVQVAWVNAPANDTIEVSILGKTNYLATSSLTSPQTVNFTIPADGTSGNNITAKWRVNSSLCQKTTTYTAPAACSNNQIGCNILYLCGLDKPYDGDSWDHGFMQYLDAVNGSKFVQPVLTKADASGMGTYDPNNPATFLTLDLNNYDLIVISATTENHIAAALVTALKNTPKSVINSNYSLIDDLGLSASAGGYQYQNNAYIDNSTSKLLLNYDNLYPWNGNVFTIGDYFANGTGLLWANANNQSTRTNSILFAYDKTDALAGVSASHGSRVYLGYHMNGVYANYSNGGALPAPVSSWFNPAKHLTLDGKNYFDQAILLAAADCSVPEICTNGIDDDGDGLADCNDSDCNVLPIAANAPTHRTIANGNWSSAATWQGGVVPSTNIGSGAVVLIEHEVKASNDILLQNGGKLFLKGGELIINGFNLTVENGRVEMSQSILQLKNSGNIQLTTSSGYFKAAHSRVLVTGQNFQNSGGKRVLDNVCLTVNEVFENSGGTDSLINVCATIGVSSSGNFINNSGTMYLANSDFNLPNGNFQNQSGATLTGSNGKIWVQNGNLSNSGTWTMAVNQYCVSGSVAVPGAYLPGSEICTNISTVFTPCDCGCAPTLEVCTNGVDDDGDGLLDCVDGNCVLPTASIVGNNNICTGGSTTLTASGGGTYLWSTGATTAAISVTPAASTTYAVTVTNATGCTATSNRTVTVSACSEICNNAIDDDGDGLIDAADPDCIACPAPTSAPYIVQEYLLPYPEDQAFNAFKSIFPNNLLCGYPTVPNVSAPLRCYISVAPYLNSTIVYYDQWEDGYETEITMPTQASTKIWGDGNPANGIPPGFATDVINAGQAIVLQNNINPSNLTLVDYDGRDRIGVSKPVSVTKSHWATGTETLLAGTMLVYPTTDWGTFFKIPLGENVNTSVQSFSYSGFSVMAHQNGTKVDIDANADGVFETNITLSKGQAYQVNGGLLKGARIQSSLPVQVYLTAGDVCDFYESRWFNIPPLDSWGNYFFGPVSGTDKMYAIYNPNATSIIIKGKTSSGNLADQTIAANSVAFTNGIANSGFQFFSKDGSPFLVLAMSDAAGTLNTSNKMFDWGSTLLPEAELNQQVIVGWAPGHDPNYSSSENSAPVWATVSSASGSSLTTTAKVCVDYDGDGIGSLTDSYGRGYDVALNLAPLVSQKVYDPDGDQTNMLLYVCDGSNALISAVWGEDAATASPATPGLDLGNGIPGIKSFYAYKTGSLFTDVNSNSLFNIGDVVQYKIGIANQGLVQTTGSYNVKDLLPSQVTYVAGSTQLTKPGPVVSAISDAGSTIFPLDEGGANVNVTLNPGQEAFITFRATVNSKPPAPGYVTNLATVSKSGLVYDLNWSFCVTVSPEICGNSIDDDQDGLTDCNDPDCFVSGAAGGGTVCLGSTISLTASGGTSYSWSGPAAFTSTAQNPTRANATALMSGNYTVTITGSGCTTTKTVAVNVSNCSPASAACDAPSCTGPSLISAGTFEGFSTGSPGFTTDFNYVNCGSIPNGYYSVLQSAANCSGTWAAAPDHTTGNGNGKYLVADFATTSPGQNGNGNSTSGELFCSVSIPVNANTNYCFSGWFLKLCSSCTGEPDIKFLVNGIQVGTVAGTAFNTGAWTKKGFSFLTSDFGNPATITVSIAQNAFGTNGFDLALDDIELREILSGTTPTVVGDVVTSCTATPLTINVLANDAGYTASTLTIVSQPPVTAGTVSKSGTSLLFTPVPGFSGQVSFSYSVCGAVNGCCTQGSVTVNIAPVTASASSDTPVCAGVDLHLTGSGGNTCAWTGPNGFTANTAYATINNATVAASGTYTVTVTNSAGCTAQATVTATVNACVTNRKPECNCN